MASCYARDVAKRSNNLCKKARGHTTDFVIGVDSLFSDVQRLAADDLLTCAPTLAELPVAHLSMPQIVPIPPEDTGPAHLKKTCCKQLSAILLEAATGDQNQVQQHAQQRGATLLSSRTTSTFSSLAAPQTCALNSSQLMCPSLFVSSWSKACHKGLKPACPMN